MLYSARILPLGRWIILVMMALTAGASSALSASRMDVSKNSNHPPSEEASPLRDVRVLLANNIHRVRIRATRPVQIYNDQNKKISTYAADAWIEIAQSQNKRIHISDVPYKTSSITIKSAKHDELILSRFRKGQWDDARIFAGTFQIQLDKKTGMDIINYISVEPYVSCVVANEVWPTFEREAFRVQAIVSRTYVLYQMLRRQNAKYDVSATQGSQVYKGIRTDSVGQKADEATRYTRGMVLTWKVGGEDRLFCAYFSAACGGLSQSAAIFGVESDIEPLHGQVSCNECKIAPKNYYRWGPVEFTKRKIYSRLIERYKDFTKLGYIESIKIIDRTTAGRPVTLRITGRDDDSLDILAERFRLAISGSKIRSTDFSLRDNNHKIIFENGKGFGHGLGLCQWGAHGMAKKGKLTSEIVDHYFPGCHLTRVY